MHTQAPEQMRCLFIVARDQPALWHSLRRGFAADKAVGIFLDRRGGERRQRHEAHAGERRRTERRQPVSVDKDLRYRSFVILYQQHGGACSGGSPLS